jgi:hypothetical protein
VSFVNAGTLTTEEEFQATFDVSKKVSDKVINRLKTKLIKSLDKDEMLLVDLFVEDALSAEDFETLKPLNMTIIPRRHSEDPNNIKVIKNGKTLDKEQTETALATLMSNQESLQDLYKEKKSHQLKKIIKTLENDLDNDTLMKLEKAAEEGVSYVTLKLPAKTVKKLLQKSSDNLNAIDVHIPLQISGIDQEPHAGDDPEVAQWRARFKSYLDSTSVSLRQDTNMYGTNWDGAGVGIYYADAFCPSVTDATYIGYTPVSSYKRLHSSSERPNTAHHTKIITGILSTVAPDAYLICRSHEALLTGSYANSSNTIYDDALPSLLEIRNEGIYVESYSLNMYASADTSNTTRRYYPMDRVFDNHAYENNIPIFMSAGNNIAENPDNDIVSPAKGFNVITVGNYQLSGTTPQLHTSSAYNRPTINGSEYQKPEITAPGTDFYYNTVSYSGPSHDIETINHMPPESGSSFATPFAAAMTANVISSFQGVNLYTNIKNWGAMYKAAALSLATDSVTTQSHNSTGDGLGGIDIAAIPYLTHIVTGDKNTYFSHCRDIENTIYIGPNTKARFVIAWFHYIPHANITKIPNTFTLEVLDANSNKVSNSLTGTKIANTPNQAFQIFEFATNGTTQGNYRGRICMTDHDNFPVLFMGASTTLRPN